MPLDASRSSPATRPARSPARDAATRWLAYGLVTAAGAAYLAWYLLRGWIAFDDGMLAHTAERVLDGELPHRDFDDTYTGLLAFYHSAGFALFGASLATIRWMLLAAFVVWVPVVLRVSERLVGLRGATLLTAVGVVWSVPNYPAGMPAWYNLFLATGAVAATLAYLDARRRRWLLLAGLCLGLSVLIKIVGLFALAGLLLFLAYDAQLEPVPAGRPPVRRDLAYAALLGIGVLLLVAAVAYLTSRAGGGGYHANFLVPVGAVSLALAVAAVRAAPAPDANRLRRLVTSAAPLLAGVALPVVAFVWAYLRVDAVGDLVFGVLVKPARRLELMVDRPPGVWKTLAYGLVLPIGAWYARRAVGWRPRHAAMLLAIGALLVTLERRSEAFHDLLWFTLVCAIPAGALVGARSLVGSDSPDSPPPEVRRTAFLLLAVGALVNLSRVPYDGPIYFGYIAPLLLVAGAAVVDALRVPRRAVAGYGLLLLAFGLADTNGFFRDLMAYQHRPRPAAARLALVRGGIVVDTATAANYAAVVALVERHSRPSDYILAGPDAPEIYFLAHRRNFTRIIFDLFDDTPDREAALLQGLERRQVPVVVLNELTTETRDFSPGFVAEVERRYPQASRYGTLTVRWR